MQVYVIANVRKFDDFGNICRPIAVIHKCAIINYTWHVYIALKIQEFIALTTHHV